MDKTEPHFVSKMSPASNNRYVAALGLHITPSLAHYLEAEVRERLVRFCHAVHFVTTLHGAAAHFGRFHQLATETLWHRFFAALVGSFTQPAHGQSHTTHWTHFDWHLVVGTADAARFYLNHR